MTHDGLCTDPTCDCWQDAAQRLFEAAYVEELEGDQ